MIKYKKPLITLTKKDFIIVYYSGSGAGGQHRNKHQNCVRISHKASGVTTTGAEQRSRLQNQRRAFNRLANSPKFRAWLKIESMYKEDILRKVKESMQSENLKIEVMKNGKWEKTVND